MAPNVYLNAPLYVSGNNLKSLALRLGEAEILLLTSFPRDDAAKALCGTLAAAVAAGETRTRPRGPKERQALNEAVAAIAGGVLIPALRRGGMVYVSRRRDEFSGADVGYHAAIAALDGLTALGYLAHYPGIRFETATFDDDTAWGGLAARYDATDALLNLAAAHGITGDTCRQNFGTRYPAKAEAVSNLVRLKAFRMGKASGGDVSIRVSRTDATYAKLKADVRLANRVLGGHTWDNCQPPQVFRTFRGDWSFGGRWIVTGKPSIQRMPPEARLEIRIDGQPVSEIDARGSQLSVVAALAGVPLLPGDPYQIGPLAGYPRDVVKAAATVTLGSGKLRNRWPAGMDHGDVVSMAEITDALVAAHPYVRNLPGRLGVPAGRVALRLQNIEAECLTQSLAPLWSAGCPAVPIHDGLLVPAAAAAMAEEALRDGYRTTTGATIQTRTDNAVDA